MTAVYDGLRKSDLLAEACRWFHVRTLDLFGSAATGRGFDPDRSDIDVLVSFAPAVQEGYADSWFGLWETLQRLSDRQVVLLTPEQLGNPSLRRRVEAELQPLFRAD